MLRRVGNRNRCPLDQEIGKSSGGESPPIKESISSHAKEFDKTEIEIENPSRRQKAIQDHRER